MSLAKFREKMRRSAQNAEVIFDPEEPVGKPTDMVLPDRRWFGRRRKGAPAQPARQPNK